MFDVWLKEIIELLFNTLRLSNGLGNGSRLDHGAFNLQIGKSRIAWASKNGGNKTRQSNKCFLIDREHFSRLKLPIQSHIDNKHLFQKRPQSIPRPSKSSPKHCHAYYKIDPKTIPSLSNDNPTRHQIQVSARALFSLHVFTIVVNEPNIWSGFHQSSQWAMSKESWVWQGLWGNDGRQ